ncbi:MAG TPA: SH3 domain-containing protein [Verrucomicrobiae bacterium]|nr:SH3 domain-containing protein [Verrucomicrobiae bacterium]
MKYGLMLAIMISTGATAQVATNAPPPLPAPGGVPAPAEPATVAPAPPPAGVDASVTAATNQPAVKKVKKSVKKKADKKVVADKKKPAKVIEAPTFSENEPAVAKQNNINVRGQANINSEVVAHLKQGESVLVLKEVTLKHPKTDEPAKWAQIALPSGTHVWVNGTFLDTNQTVVATKLNVRTGPGENYSVVGMLHKGDAVKALNVKGDWAEIDAPTNAFAFVAAHLLARKEAGTTPTEPVVPPVATVVDNGTPVAVPAGGNPTTTTNEPTPPTTPVVTPTIPAPLPPPAVEEPPAKRIVQREGIVGGTVSIQAPTHFELESLDDGKPMDYLYSASTNLVLQRYKGLTVLVSGEEALDERWPNTPVITIQKIQVVK